jgi:hypothetical protein
VRDVADRFPDDGLGDSGCERVLCDVEEPLRLGVDLPHAERVGAVGDVAVERRPTSIVTTSPSCTTKSSGMPCTTTSFGEMQIAFG